MEGVKFTAFQTAPASTQMEADLLRVIRSLAEFSRHPLAPEMIKVAEANRIEKCPVFGFQDFGGEGFGGAVQLPGEGGPRAVLVGLRRFLEEAGMSVPNILEVAARQWEKEGAHVLFAGWDGYVRGLLKFK
jgi:cation transport ATPase